MTAVVFHSQINKGVPEVLAREVYELLDEALAKNVLFIDVRRPDEFNNDLSHIHGACLIPLGEALTDFLDKGLRQTEIVFICRSGVRSEVATLESMRLGYKNTANMVGGMLLWNELKLPTVGKNEV